MRDKIREMERECLFGISNWWGLRDAGSRGTFITKDYMLYSYTLYSTDNIFTKEHNIPKESMSKGIKLNDTDIKKINKFIEENIKGKDFDRHMIFDAGWSVFGEYEGKRFGVVNHHDVYELAQKLINEIKGGN